MLMIVLSLTKSVGGQVTTGSPVHTAIHGQRTLCRGGRGAEEDKQLNYYTLPPRKRNVGIASSSLQQVLRLKLFWCCQL